VFELFPVLFSLFLAFHRWDGLGEMQYVGLQVALSQLNRSYGRDYSMIMAGALLGRWWSCSCCSPAASSPTS
jgi:hypothetical protein